MLIPLIFHLHKAWLRLYPKAFRVEFGDELQGVHAKSTRRILFFLCMLSLLLNACQPAPIPTPTIESSPIPAPSSIPTVTNTPKPGPTITSTAAPTLPLVKDTPEHITFPKIDRQPRPVTIEDWAPAGMGKTLTALPSYDPNSDNMYQMDLRTQDLSHLDLKNSLDDLLNALFDDHTVWPSAVRMPAGFDWERIMELGKNPGLGIRKLHEQGITGKNIGIAIIDMPMLVTHEEYADRLHLYEEINVDKPEPSELHGPAVVSIAAGRTVGVAPEADLYCIATYPADWDENGKWSYNFTYIARAIQRILDINRQLPKDAKIRVISMSFGWGSQDKGYDEVMAAVQEARDTGMLVLSNSHQDPFGFIWRDGLGRGPLNDPDDFNSYERAWAVQILSPKFPKLGALIGHFLIPLDSRTTASPFGNDAYVFYRRGGESWGPPTLAGLYALAAQVDPAITPERFWELAAKTGRTVEVSRDDNVFQLGPILDPGALIQALQ